MTFEMLMPCPFIRQEQEVSFCADIFSKICFCIFTHQYKGHKICSVNFQAYILALKASRLLD